MYTAIVHLICAHCNCAQLLDTDAALAKEMLYSLSKEVFRMSK